MEIAIDVDVNRGMISTWISILKIDLISMLMKIIKMRIFFVQS